MLKLLQRQQFKLRFTVVWKYFVVKKFLWVMEPTNIFTRQNFNMNNKQGSYAM